MSDRAELPEVEWPYCYKRRPVWPNCYCFEKPGHDGPHRCCGGSTGEFHEW